MKFAKEKLQEINEMAEEYSLYLINQDQEIDLNKIKKGIIALQALYWQAGEQIENLLNLIKKKPTDGFTFRMLISTAYSILESLEVAAEYAHIGDKIKRGYIIKSETHLIESMKLYGKREFGEIETTDYDYFRFIRSFISAHPLDTTYSLEGFMPNEYAYCKFVDYIGNDPLHFDKPPGADYWVQALDGERHQENIDFYINSSEIWAYVESRYIQLIDTIWKTMTYRISETIEKLKNTPLPACPESINSEYLETLIREDWKRGGSHHTDLMRCKLTIQKLESYQWDGRYIKILKHAIRDYIQKIADSLQKMDYEGVSDTYGLVSDLMTSIGCDHNQCSNIWCLLHDQYDFGIDCETYVEHGTENYQEHPSDPDYINARRKNIYQHLEDCVAPELNRDERIDIVTECYCSTNWPKSEIARIYFLVVLPDFVKKYQLSDKLCCMDSYELFQYLIACALTEVEHQMDGCNYHVNRVHDGETSAHPPPLCMLLVRRILAFSRKIGIRFRKFLNTGSHPAP